MADVCHVYGVAEIIRTACRQLSADDEPDILIRDLGPAWVIEAPTADIESEQAREIADRLTAPVFTPKERPEEGDPPSEWYISRGWNYLNVTNRTGKDKSAQALRKTLQDLVPQLMAASGEASADVHSLYGARHDASIPQGLETAAGKSSRSASRSSYSEGGTKRPLGYWAVSSVGAMAVGTFIYARQGQGDMAALPVPADVTYRDNLEIRDVVRSGGRLCSASTTAAMAHYAVRLARTAAQRQKEGARMVSQYAAVVFESMSRTGQQPKPAHGGLFPMDYLNTLAADNPERAIALFDTWDKILVQGSFKGRELLALSLTGFLMQPNLSNLERHWRVHLRLSLREKSDSQRVAVSYPENAMEGLMQHVRA